MRKALMIAKRDYLASVKTKGFLIMLIVLPIMMSGSIMGMALLKDKGDKDDLHIAVVDHSGVITSTLLEVVANRNANDITDEESGKKLRPAFVIEDVVPSDDASAQGLELSDRVRDGDLHAYLIIGKDVLQPVDESENSRITYHAENSSIDNVRSWLRNPVNNILRQTRAREAGVSEEELANLFHWISVEGLNLATIDADTGEVEEATKSNEAVAIFTPLILVMLMFMMFMVGAVPLLSAVMEEKSQRIAEVMLGSVKPFEFMIGKVIGGVGVSLTGVLMYVAIGIFALNKLNYTELIPWDVLPWFFGLLVLALTMMGATMAALGAACNDNKEAQSLTLPSMMPVMIPLFVMVPILEQPDSTFATVMSLIPPFTPMIMVMRIASPISIPFWQPWLGLLLLVLTTVAAIWAGGRVFRVAILMQGTPPKIQNFMKWVLRG